MDEICAFFSFSCAGKGIARRKMKPKTASDEVNDEEENLDDPDEDKSHSVSYALLTSVEFFFFMYIFWIPSSF